MPDVDRAEHCRQKAAECRELAQRARDIKIRAQLLALADQWLALASDIEKSRHSQLRRQPFLGDCGGGQV
jgi:hypothetical protein